jgi:hypothetical protein
LFFFVFGIIAGITSQDGQRISIVPECVLKNHGATVTISSAASSSSDTHSDSSDSGDMVIPNVVPSIMSTTFPITASNPSIFSHFLKQRQSLDVILSKNMKKQPVFIPVPFPQTSPTEVSTSALTLHPIPVTTSSCTSTVNPPKTTLAVAGGGESNTSARRTPQGSGREMIPFKCPLCSLIYRTQSFLNDHMRKEHSVLI